MGIQLPGSLLPGAVGVVETKVATVTITGTAASGTATFSLDGDFDAVASMAVLTDGAISVLSAASSSTNVTDTDADLQNATTDSIDVTAELDAAPGSGESTDVQVSLVVAEGGD